MGYTDPPQYMEPWSKILLRVVKCVTGFVINLKAPKHDTVTNMLMEKDPSLMIHIHIEVCFTIIVRMLLWLKAVKKS